MASESRGQGEGFFPALELPLHHTLTDSLDGLGDRPFVGLFGQQALGVFLTFGQVDSEGLSPCPWMSIFTHTNAQVHT